MNALATYHTTYSPSIAFPRCMFVFLLVEWLPRTVPSNHRHFRIYSRFRVAYRSNDDSCSPVLKKMAFILVRRKMGQFPDISTSHNPWYISWRSFRIPLVYRAAVAPRSPPGDDRNRAIASCCTPPSGNESRSVLDPSFPRRPRTHLPNPA